MISYELHCLPDGPLGHIFKKQPGQLPWLFQSVKSHVGWKKKHIATAEDTVQFLEAAITGAYKCVCVLPDHDKLCLSTSRL